MKSNEYTAFKASQLDIVKTKEIRLKQEIVSFITLQPINNRKSLV